MTSIRACSRERARNRSEGALQSEPLLAGFQSLSARGARLARRRPSRGGEYWSNTAQILVKYWSNGATNARSRARLEGGGEPGPRRLPIPRRVQSRPARSERALSSPARPRFPTAIVTAAVSASGARTQYLTSIRPVFDQYRDSCPRRGQHV